MTHQRKCKRCNRKAKYVVQGGLCTKHWAEWWTDGLLPRDNRRAWKDELNFTMKSIKQNRAAQKNGRG